MKNKGEKYGKKQHFHLVGSGVIGVLLPQGYNNLGDCFSRFNLHLYNIVFKSDIVGSIISAVSFFCVCLSNFQRTLVTSSIFRVIYTVIFRLVLSITTSKKYFQFIYITFSRKILSIRDRLRILLNYFRTVYEFGVGKLKVEKLKVKS